MTGAEPLRRLIELGAFAIGDFVLSSGARSPYYLDMRRAISDPETFRWTVGLYMRALEGVEYDVLVGIECGSVPFASVLGYTLGRPVLYVRKKPKEYGTRSLVEGRAVQGQRAVIIDDVLTTGRSISGAVAALRDVGIETIAAVVFVDREQCGRERLSELGLEVRSVYTVSRLVEELYGFGLIGPHEREHVLGYVTESKSRCF